ncbi:MAG TPA: carbohydrate kinase family protein [Candidatus Paceibacterota bacterium]|nr:carbohydrate kinase family protein [Candidatus Paceibacterota bacterium]
MKRKYDLVCIGDVVMDAFITLERDQASVHWDAQHENPELRMPFATKIPYESLTVATAVGNSSNVAVGAARLGLRTGIITSVGRDMYGREIIDWYRKEKISEEFVRVDRERPTNYHFVLTYEAERTILIKHQDYDYYDPRKLDTRADWLYFSSIGEHALSIHDKVAEYLKKHPGVRMGFNPGTFQLKFGPERLKQVYKHTYVLFLNREEGEMVAHKKEGTPLPELMGALHKLGPKIVVVTDGPKGAYASDGVSRWFMPPYPDPKPPVSRTGAGDAFSTGFLCALIYGKPVPEALRWAPIESMHVVQFFGAQTGLLSRPKLTQLLKKAPKKYQAKAI